MSKPKKARIYYTRDTGKESLYCLWIKEPMWSEKFKQWLMKGARDFYPTKSDFAPLEGFPELRKGQMMVFEQAK